MNSIESWGAVIGIVAYFLFKFVGKALNSPVDPEAPSTMPGPQTRIPELDQKDDMILKKIILENALSERKKAKKMPKAESRFGEEIVEAQIAQPAQVVPIVEEEEAAGIQFDFSDYDELKRGLIYSEILQRRY